MPRAPAAAAKASWSNCAGWSRSAEMTEAADTAALPICVAALYQFTRFDDPAALQGPLAKLCCAQGVKGTLLLAREGVNGTIAGSDDAIAAVVAHVRALPGCA